MPLSDIQPRNTFYDTQSEEDSTGGVKPKYKVSVFGFDFMIGKHAFYVLTSKETYNLKTRVQLNLADFEDVQPGYFPKWPSYACPSHVVFESSEGYMEKRRNANNGFAYVGRLCANKFDLIKGNAYRIAQLNLSKAKKEELIGISIGPERAQALLKNMLS